MKKTETRYVVERRVPAWSGGGWRLAVTKGSLPEAQKAKANRERVNFGVRFRIVRVTTTREVVR